MEIFLPIRLEQEIIFASSDARISKQISKLEKAGKLRKLSKRVYTSNFHDSLETITRRNLFTILGHLYPKALLSHRSALEFTPTSTGKLYLTYKYTKKVALPGITIHFLKGNLPIENDTIFSGELYVSQRERAFLENLQTSRKIGANSKTLAFPKIEEELEKIVRFEGEEKLNEIRDKAQSISEELGMEKEFRKLDKLISALLTTRPSKILTSEIARARAFGIPYDPFRITLFEKLYQELMQHKPNDWEEKNTENTAFKNFAFFESYFSNYIEGTVFRIEQAKEIITTQMPMISREEDSHDVLGTYQLVSNKKEMSITPSSSEEFIDILTYRHKVLLSARTSKKPGMFKDRNNFAGETTFVDFNLVRGTLIKCFEFYNALKKPFSKAAYMMFVISEIHPFLDGNGRIARVMMNAELTKHNQTRIIILTAYRDDYILSLRKLTRQHEPAAFVRMLSKIHKFSTQIVGNDFGELQKILENSNAFLEPLEGKLKM